MKRGRHLLLIGLIALALPFKGIAAVAMACGPGPAGDASHAGHAGQGTQNTRAGHGHAAAQGAQPAAGSQRAQAGHDAHRAAPDGTHAHAATAHDEPDVRPSSPPHEGVKCSSCAPCSAAVAPAPQPGDVSQPAPAATLAAFGGTRYVGVIADVPHRPPRPTLA